MTEPMKDMSLAPLAAIRCGNIGCLSYDAEKPGACAINNPETPTIECDGYRPSDHVQDVTKMVTSDAIAELAKLKRAMELTGVKVPDIDIDDTMYEYSPRGNFDEGKWQEVFSASTGWLNNSTTRDRLEFLTRRRRRVRRAPTDADAVAVPRRDCWVLIDGQWIEAKLLMVAAGVKNPYLVIRTENSVGWYQQCEIEVEA